MVKDDINVIYLAENCISKPAVVHEVMHSLGFRHEHTRNDRDNYLSISKEIANDEEESK